MPGTDSAHLSAAVSKIHGFVGLPPNVEAAAAALSKVRTYTRQSVDSRPAKDAAATAIADWAASSTAEPPKGIAKQVSDAVALAAADRDLREVTAKAVELVENRLRSALIAALPGEVYPAIKAKADAALAEVGEVAAAVPADADDASMFRADDATADAYRRLCAAADTVAAALDVMRTITGSARLDSVDGGGGVYAGLKGTVVEEPDRHAIPGGPDVPLSTTLRSLAIARVPMSFATADELDDRLSKAQERAAKANRDDQMAELRRRGIVHA